MKGPSSIFHLPSSIIHRTSFIFHRPSYIVHRSSYIIHRTSSIVHHPSYIIHRTSFIVHRTFLTPNSVPHTNLTAKVQHKKSPCNIKSQGFGKCSESSENSETVPVLFGHNIQVPTGDGKVPSFKRRNSSS